MTDPIDYANPPDWFRSIFSAMYGEDLSGAGPSAVHILSMALFLAASLDLRDGGNERYIRVRQLLLDSFTSDGDSRESFPAMLAESERILGNMDLFAIDDDNAGPIGSMLELLEQEIGHIAKMMSGFPVQSDT